MSLGVSSELQVIREHAFALLKVGAPRRRLAIGITVVESAAVAVCIIIVVSSIIIVASTSAPAATIPVVLLVLRASLEGSLCSTALGHHFPATIDIATWKVS